MTDKPDPLAEAIARQSIFRDIEEQRAAEMVEEGFSTEEAFQDVNDLTILLQAAKAHHAQTAPTDSTDAEAHAHKFMQELGMMVYYYWRDKDRITEAQDEKIYQLAKEFAAKLLSATAPVPQVPVDAYEFAKHIIQKFKDCFSTMDIIKCQDLANEIAQRDGNRNELQMLWDVVCVQETGEQKAAFMVNWLRGTIKIPEEVMVRIKHMELPTPPRSKQ